MGELGLGILSGDRGTKGRGRGKGGIPVPGALYFSFLIVFLTMWFPKRCSLPH